MQFKDGTAEIDRLQLKKFYTDEELSSRRLALIEPDMTFAVLEDGEVIGFFILSYLSHVAFLFDMEIVKEHRNNILMITEFSQEIIKRVKSKGINTIMFNVDITNTSVVNMHTKRGAVYQKTMLMFLNDIENYSVRKRR